MPRLTIRMPQQLVDALDERSAASGLGVSEHVRRILLEALKEV
jgi:metal-responsive CopG/Arc/MetJ family transcriptional regulator